VQTQGEHVYDITVRIRRHDGMYRWFRVRGTPVFTEDGAVLKWIGTCTDVHDRVQNEEQRRAMTPRPRPGAHFEFGLGRLQRRLFLVVLAGLLPVVLLCSAILVRNASDQKRVVLDSASDTMRAVLTAVDGELSAISASLQTLAGSPRLANDDLAAFHEEARKAIGVRPGLLNIVLSRPTGEQVLNARVPFGDPLPHGVDIESVRQAVNARAPVVGNIVYGPVTGTHVFSVRVPIVRNGRVEYVLNARGSASPTTGSR
jgi:hypothetical protein